jgi:hypothetical protein
MFFIWFFLTPTAIANTEISEPLTVNETLNFTPPQGYRAIMSAGNSDYHTTSYAPIGDNAANPSVLIVLTGFNRRGSEPQDYLNPLIISAFDECPGAKVKTVKLDTEAEFEAFCPAHGKFEAKTLMIRALLGNKRVYNIRFQAKGKLNTIEKKGIRNWLKKAQIRYENTSPQNP